MLTADLSVVPVHSRIPKWLSHQQGKREFNFRFVLSQGKPWKCTRHGIVAVSQGLADTEGKTATLTLTGTVKSNQGHFEQELILPGCQMLAMFDETTRFLLREIGTPATRLTGLRDVKFLGLCGPTDELGCYAALAQPPMLPGTSTGLIVLTRKDEANTPIATGKVIYGNKHTTLQASQCAFIPKGSLVENIDRERMYQILPHTGQWQFLERGQFSEDGRTGEHWGFIPNSVYGKTKNPIWLTLDFAAQAMGITSARSDGLDSPQKVFFRGIPTMQIFRPLKRGREIRADVAMLPPSPKFIRQRNGVVTLYQDNQPVVTVILSGDSIDPNAKKDQPDQTDSASSS